MTKDTKIAVRAIAMGFYEGVRRRAGDVFFVPEGSNAKWFEPVDGELAKKYRTANLEKDAARKAADAEAKAARLEAEKTAQAAKREAALTAKTKKDEAVADARAKAAGTVKKKVSASTEDSDPADDAKGGSEDADLA